MSHRHNRQKALFGALLASLLAHLIVLGLSPKSGFSGQPPSFRPLEVVMLPSTALASKRYEPEPAPAPQAERVASGNSRFTRPITPHTSAEPDVLTIPPPTDNAASPTSQQVPIVAPPSEPASSGAASVAQKAGLFDGYKLALAEHVGRQRVYPVLAQVRGWEGTVLLHLRFSPQGELLEARLESSSGRELLDRQALDMARRLSSWPQPPDALRGGEISVLVPVVFRLLRQP